MKKKDKNINVEITVDDELLSNSGRTGLSSAEDFAEKMAQTAKKLVTLDKNSSDTYVDVDRIASEVGRAMPDQSLAEVLATTQRSTVPPPRRRDAPFR